MVTRVLPSRCFDLLLSLSALTDSLPSTLFSRSTHKLSFAEMTNPARLLFQNSGRVLDFSLLLLSNSPSLADGFWCLVDSDCLRSLPLALPSLSLSPSSNPHPPSLTYTLHCPHFKSCSECTHEFNLHRPVIDEATEFFKTVGVSDFTFDSCKFVTTKPPDWALSLGTHSVVDIPQCKAHCPSINAAVELPKEALQLLHTNCSKIPALKHLRSLTHPSGINTPKKIEKQKVGGLDDQALPYF
ncbi:hypothetical protein ACFX14_045949 [Malus domestica]